MIFLWGVPADPPLAAVHRELERLGAPFAFFDQRALETAELELRLDAGLTGVLRVNGEELDLSSVTAAYVRPYSSRELPSVLAAGAGTTLWDHALSVDDALTLWCDLTPARVLNRPRAASGNTSKPYQAAQIVGSGSGFRVPATLVTTDRHAVEEFQARHGEVIYKSVSCTRSIVSRLKPGRMSDLDDVAACPTQFQEYIAGREFRVHVIDDEVFACEIVSDADDYRQAALENNGAELRDVGLPAALKTSCRALTRALEMTIAGIDLRLTPEGEWYCFEVNPSPGFTFY